MKSYFSSSGVHFYITHPHALHTYGIYGCVVFSFQNNSGTVAIYHSGQKIAEVKADDPASFIGDITFLERLSGEVTSSELGGASATAKAAKDIEVVLWDFEELRSLLHSGQIDPIKFNLVYLHVLHISIPCNRCA